MTAVVPSHIAKVSRAKKHIIDLEAEIERYAATKPYTVRSTVKGKKKVRTLEFTADPMNTEIPQIAADAINNLRASLDHLMSVLVPSNRRSSVMFPIFWQGVWEPSVPGENPERIKARERWSSCVKTLPDDAVTVLKRLQPPDGGGEPDHDNLLVIVNRLSNTDRHTRLPVAAAGLRVAVVGWKTPGGKTFQTASAIPDRDGFLEDHATIRDIPEAVVDVKIEGSPLVAICVKHEKGDRRRYIELPGHLLRAIDFVESVVIPKLSPYVRRGTS